MSELSMLLKEKYKDFEISPQHLGRIMRNHNRTRKRTRHEHFPDERRKNPTDKEQELNDFYNTVKKYLYQPEYSIRLSQTYRFNRV